MSEEKLQEKAALQFVLGKAGLDIPFMIQEAFLGYKYRKIKKKLYEVDGEIPTKLIKMYYSLNPGQVEFDNLKTNFISKYVKNESKLEGVNDESIHGKEEIMGMKDMYEYLHSNEMEEDFSVYSLKELHRKLFSHTQFPQYAGRYRNKPAYLPGTGIDLSDWSMINEELYLLSPRIDYLHEKAKYVKSSADIEELLGFLDECVELKCRLIKIHPFSDGNGRVIRAFINKLLEDAGLPPVYIKSNERTEYHTAMNLALGEEDDSYIKSFYRYKICDSIIELDINERLKKKTKENTEEKEKKKKIYTHYFNIIKENEGE